MRTRILQETYTLGTVNQRAIAYTAMTTNVSEIDERSLLQRILGSSWGLPSLSVCDQTGYLGLSHEVSCCKCTSRV